MLLPLLATLCTLVASNYDNCNACVGGWCHTRKTLIQGFRVTQLAVDHTYNVVYMQLNSILLCAYFLDKCKIRFIHSLRVSGITVDQKSHDLYVADYNSTLYVFRNGSITPEIFTNTFAQDVHMLFYDLNEEKIYYTNPYTKEINVIDQTKHYYWCSGTRNLTISDFVVSNRNVVYYVTNNKVFALNSSLTENSTSSRLIMDKPCVLSVDRHFNTYLLDANEKVMYKLNEYDEAIEYAAYKTGTIDRFVFGSHDNIVFHDADDGSIYTWKKLQIECKVHAPRDRTIDILDDYAAVTIDN